MRFQAALEQRVGSKCPPYKRIYITLNCAQIQHFVNVSGCGWQIQHFDGLYGFVGSHPNLHSYQHLPSALHPIPRPFATQFYLCFFQFPFSVFLCHQKTILETASVLGVEPNLTSLFFVIGENMVSVCTPRLPATMGTAFPTLPFGQFFAAVLPEQGNRFLIPI